MNTLLDPTAKLCLHEFAVGMVLSALSVLGGCKTIAAPPTAPEKVVEIFRNSGLVKGYLDRSQLPDSLALLPQAPAHGSRAQVADLAAHQATRLPPTSSRWAPAAADNELAFPQAVNSFSSALGVPTNTEPTPHLTMLLRRSMVDAALSTYGAKHHYQRQRPFVALKEDLCVTSEAARLVKDVCYPSGHAAAGCAGALLLTELVPEIANALLQRSHDFGQIRVMCGAHWQSDVDNGRVMDAATVATLHADATFQGQATLEREVINRASSINGARPSTFTALR